MRLGGTRMGRGAQLVLAWLGSRPCRRRPMLSSFAEPPMRPPNDVPSVPPGPAQSIAPPGGNPAPAAAQGPACCKRHPPPGSSGAPGQAAPTVPAGQGALAMSARFGRDLPAINGGLHWRVYRAEAERRAAPGQGGQGTVTHLRAGARHLCRQRHVRARERDQDRGPARREDDGGVRYPGRRPAHRGQGRRRQDPAGTDFLRSLQGQPVRARRQARDRAPPS